MSSSAPADRARQLFVTDHYSHGCAEASLVALQEHYGLSDAGDSSAAMALNGGIAYWGGTCGAITGAALAVGRLAGERIADHSQAKRVARRIVQRLMADFSAEHGSLDCRTLTGYDMITDHDAFLEDGSWKVTCSAQIESTIRHLEGLADRSSWDAAVTDVSESGEVPRGSA